MLLPQVAIYVFMEYILFVKMLYSLNCHKFLHNLKGRSFNSNLRYTNISLGRFIPLECIINSLSGISVPPAPSRDITALDEEYNMMQLFPWLTVKIKIDLIGIVSLMLLICIIMV